MFGLDMEDLRHKALVVNKVMRTAILLSGHMRTYKDCYKSLLENLVKPYGADVFVSTWDTLGYSINKPPHVYRKIDLPIGETAIREAYGDFLLDVV